MLSIRLILLSLFLAVNVVTGDSTPVTVESINETLSNFNQESFDALLTKIGTNWTNNEYQQTLLHISARNGYYNASEALIKKDPSLVNATDKDHWLPLHYAAFKGKCDIVSLLVSNGADVNALAKFDNDGSTTIPSVSPIYLAARKGHVECVRVLLEKGANINHQTHQGETPLHIASREGHYEVVKLLIERGADIEIKNKDGKTAIKLAKDKEIIDYLVRHSKYPVHSAVSLNSTDVLNEMIAANVSVNITNDDGETPLHIAAWEGNYEAAKALIAKDSSLVNATDKYHQTPLHIAALNGRCDIIKLLLSNGAHVNALGKFIIDGSTTPSSISALHFAAFNGSVECVRVLLDNGADINHQDRYGRTALHIASQFDRYDVVKLLVERGADSNVTDNNGKTALQLTKNKKIIDYLVRHDKYPVHSAVLSDLMDVFNELISSNVSINTTNEYQQTPLHIAAWKGNYEIVKALVNKDPQLVNVTDKYHAYPLHVAAFNGHCDIVSLLLDNGANVNGLSKFDDEDSTTSPSVSPLYLAARKGHVECVRILLDKGAKVDQKTGEGWTALHIAAKKGYYSIAKMLIDKDHQLINVTDKYHAYPLHYAALNGCCRIVSLLLDNGANVNGLSKFDDEDSTTSPSVSPAYLSARKGHTECLRILLDNGAKVDQQTEEGWTALHIASLNGKYDVAKLLIDKSPQLVNVTDKYHAYPLHVAAFNGHCDIVSLLLDNGANVNGLSKFDDEDSTTSPSVSALHLAAYNGSVECIKVLLNNGADINHQTGEGWTALHIASLNGKYEVAKLLIENGADSNVTDNNGKTALNLAKDEEIIRYLTGNIKYPVHSAVLNDLMDVLNELIAANVSVNTTNECQQTRLHIAAWKGNYEAAKLLVNKDPQLVNVTDKDHWYPLHMAARNGYCDIVSLLVDNGADVNALAKFSNDNSTTPLHVSALYLSALNGHTKCIRVLLSNGADTNHQNKDGRTALHVASQEGHYEAAKALIYKDPSLVNIANKYHQTPLHIAALNGRCNIVSLLLENNADVNTLANYGNDSPETSPSVSALYWAAYAGSVECVRILLDNGADIDHQDYQGQTAFHVASLKGYYSIAKMLISKDPQLVNATDKYHMFPIHYAAFEGYCDIIKLLLSNNADVNALAKFNTDNSIIPSSVSALYWAARYGYTECVRVLLDNGADIDHRTHQGLTALHIASKLGYYETAKALIAKDSSLVNATDEYHIFPIHYAAFKGYCDIVSLLVEKGADVNVLVKFTNDNSTTSPHVSAVYLAAKGGYPECVKILLDKGANINHQTRKGKTALHIASEYGYYEVAKLLVERGADVNIKNNDGKIALQLAKNNELVDYLTEKTPKSN